MHWQDAVEQSAYDRAERHDGDVWYVRYRNGFCTRHYRGSFRAATRRESEGCLDWEPMEGKVDTRTVIHVSPECCEEIKKVLENAKDVEIVQEREDKP